MVIVKLDQVESYVDRKTDLDLLGVITEHTLPRHSQGTDFVVVLKVVDDTRHIPEVTVNIFTKYSDELPSVRSIGDLLLLRRVRIKKHHGNTYVYFAKHRSSFSLFHRYPSLDVTSYQPPDIPCFPNYEGRLAYLRLWSSTFDFDASVATNEYPLFKLRDLKEKEYFDLLCKIVHVAEFDNKWSLYAWDGTDAPPLSINTRLDEDQNPLPLNTEPSPISQELVSKLNRCGTVLRLTVDKCFEKLDPQFWATQPWLMLRNITCKTVAGLWLGCFTPNSKFRLLSNTNVLVTECKRNYIQRKADQNCFPFWCDQSSSSLTGFFFPENTNYAKGRTVSLIEVIACRKERVLFKCKARVVAIFPSKVEGFCRSAKNLVRLTLCDPTTRIHAFVNWVDFFGKPSSTDVLRTKVNKLLGEPAYCDDSEYKRDPPWIWCAITYRYLNSSSGNKIRTYYILHTKIVE